MLFKNKNKNKNACVRCELSSRSTGSVCYPGRGYVSVDHGELYPATPLWLSFEFIQTRIRPFLSLLAFFAWHKIEAWIHLTQGNAFHSSLFLYLSFALFVLLLYSRDLLLLVLCSLRFFSSILSQEVSWSRATKEQAEHLNTSCFWLKGGARTASSIWFSLSLCVAELRSRV